MATAKKIKKAQTGVTATPDSTEYFRRKALNKGKDLLFTDRPGVIKAYKNDIEQSLKDMKRQKLKGKPGYDKDGFPVKEKAKSGAKIKDKNWIQDAVNPKHKGYCTPMTKATCTPKRKALAKTFKAMGRARKAK